MTRAEFDRWMVAMAVILTFGLGVMVGKLA